MFDDLCSFHVSQCPILARIPWRKSKAWGCLFTASYPWQGQGCFTPWLLAAPSCCRGAVSAMRTLRLLGEGLEHCAATRGLHHSPRGPGSGPKRPPEGLGATMFYPVHLVVKGGGGIGCSRNMRFPPNQTGAQHPRTDCHLHRGCSSSSGCIAIIVPIGNPNCTPRCILQVQPKCCLLDLVL